MKKSKSFGVFFVTVFGYSFQASAIERSIDSVGVQVVKDGDVLNDAKVFGRFATSPDELIFSLQVINSGGVANNTWLEGGVQVVQSGGISNSSSLNDMLIPRPDSFTSYQLLMDGSVANDTSASGAGQHIYDGALSNRFTAINGAQFVNAGGQAIDNTLETSIQRIPGGAAIGTILSNKSEAYISDNGVSTNINATDSRIEIGKGGGTVRDVYLDGSFLNSAENGRVYNLNVINQSTVLFSHDTIADSLTFECQVSEGCLMFENRGSASNVILNYGVVNAVSSGPTEAARQYNTLVNTGAYIEVDGDNTEVSMTTLDGGDMNLYGGTTLDTIINNDSTQYVYGGIAKKSLINAAGTQNVEDVGISHDTLINQGGIQNIISGGRAELTVINSGGVQNINDNGLASDSIVNKGGVQNVNSGGVAELTEVNSGGVQNVNDNGLASDSTVNKGGVQNINSGGVAELTEVNSGGVQNIKYGGVAELTEINGGGVQDISDNGLARDSIVNQGGVQLINTGGAADKTTVALGGEQLVKMGAVASNSVITDGGLQIISSGGSGSSTVLQYGALSNIMSGGSSIDITQDIGAALVTNTAATVSGKNYKGVFSIDPLSKTATNIVLENGGRLEVLPGAIAISSTVNEGGELKVSGGTLLSGHTTINDKGMITGQQLVNEGVLEFIPVTETKSWTGHLSGNGTLAKSGSGVLSLSGVLLQNELHLEDGSLFMHDLQAGTNVIGKSGAQLILTGTSVLTGTIDPVDVTLNSGTTWNNTGHSLVDTLINSGHINFVQSSGNFSPRSITMKNLDGRSGTITLNAVLGDSTSPTDKLVIDGGEAKGVTILNIRNVGGSGALTSGEGIHIVEAVNGALTGKAFIQRHRIQAGAYDYILKKSLNTEDWYLTSFILPSPGQTTDRQNIIRPEAAAYGANILAVNSLFISTLHDRVGEVRYIDPDGKSRVSSMWIRNIGGHNRSRDNSGQNKTQANRYAFQLGGDIASWSSDAYDRWHLGLMVGQGSQRARTVNHHTAYRARSSVSGYSSGIYLTWLQDNDERNGAYIDSWALHSWYNNSVNGDDNPAETYKSRGLTASVESGYTWKLSDISKRSSWYIQPQIQAVWMGVKASEHRESNDTLVLSNGAGNLQSRLGVRTYLKGHNHIDDGKQRTFEPFIEVNWVHNSKLFGSTLNDVRTTQDGTRNIVDVKTGVEAKLNNKLHLWGSVAHKVGGKGYSDTQGTVGFKVLF